MKPIAAIKCPFCLGNTNNDRKTLYLYSTDTYWCARCKSNGVISDLEPDMLAGITPKIKQTIDQAFNYNDRGDRFSVCKKRYFDGIRDVFQIKLADGTLAGHSIRKDGKQSEINGTKAFCYREQFLDLSQTYRIVEGCYDCVYPNDVAVLGYPTEFQAKQLKWWCKHNQLILCPDGDVWTDVNNLQRWIKPFEYYDNLIIEYIPDKLDPDECTQDKRKQLQLKIVTEYIKRKLHND